MKNFNNKQNVSLEEKFTGAKTPEYAVFYNIAYWWLSDTLKILYRSSSKNGEDRKHEK